MAGNREGGKRAAETNKLRYDEMYADYGGFYGYIGQKGGKTTSERGTAFGGFAGNHELARIAGRKGGSVSKRGPGRKKQDA